MLYLGEVIAPRAVQPASPSLQAGVDQLQSLTLHDCGSQNNKVSSLVAEECDGIGLVAHTPHQVVDGVLHTAPTGGVADCRLREYSVLH